MIKQPRWVLWVLGPFVISWSTSLSADSSIFQYQRFERVGNTLWEKWDFPPEMLTTTPPAPAFYPAMTLEQEQDLSQDQYYYDCSVPFSDNDERAFACASYQGETLELAWKMKSKLPYHTFEEISQALTPELERLFDLIFIVNTAPNNQKGFIPGQHLLVVQRNYRPNADQGPSGISTPAPKSALLFTRDQQGLINGLTSATLPLSKIIPQVQLKGAGSWTRINGLELIPISSGAIAAGSIDTFSGVFQLNWKKSQGQLATSWRAPMSYSLFVSYWYGKASGVAIHGTPANNWQKLGQRASHGCIRIHPHYGQQFFQLVRTMVPKGLPVFDWNYQFPQMNGENALLRPVLIVLFKGYGKK